MLIERPVDFANGFRMCCVNCRASNWLSPEEYAESPESMMNCSSCGDAFNFGPAVIELADAEDPALDDTAVPQLAWYHTTTDPEWPGPSKIIPEGQLQGLRAIGWREDQLKRHQKKWENQAIHLGTYEAAIDSMLRRMRNQDDQHSVFYLHRVRLRPDLVIEPGWRDENSAQAASVTTFDLASQGIDGIRYLNAYEAIGSLSLAVVHNSIESTQRIVLPIAPIVGKPDEDVLAQLGVLRDQVCTTFAEHLDDELTPLAKLRQGRAAQTGKAAAMVPLEVYGVIRKMEALAADNYLQGLSPVAKDNFLRSLHSPGPGATYEKDRAWLEKFMGLAALLTHHEEVQQFLTVQPRRAP
ncbi:UNVERIFIED_ORG: hypothetical protein ABIB13_002245 [Arthrobacter sp. UYEF2]